MKKAQEAGIGWVVCGGKNHLRVFDLCKSLKWDMESMHNAQFSVYLLNIFVRSEMMKLGDIIEIFLSLL